MKQASGVKRLAAALCRTGDWVEIMEFPEWMPEGSPYEWLAPTGEAWHFAFTEVPTIAGGEEVGTDYVWMRFDPAEGPPTPPKGIVGFRTGTDAECSDPADWWKSE